jgi:hypothetical protein
MPRSTRPLAVAAALAALAGCGRGADFWIHGTGVVVDSPAPFAHRQDFPARVESTLEAALAYWGGSWRDLEGMVITFTGAPSVSCGGTSPALGCYDGDIRLTTEDPGMGTFHCVEQTILVHEVGHAVVGDRLHQDPRWMELEPVGQALSGRRGWSGTDEVECVIWVSVWRHPLGRP